MIKTHGLLSAAGRRAADAGGVPATLEWNPQVLGTSVVRGLWNPFGDNSSVTEAANVVSQVDDLSGNGFHLIGFNSPSWNSGTVECNIVDNSHLKADIDTAPSSSVGHLFFYGQLGSSTDSFGRYIGVDGENDLSQSDYVSPLVRAGGNIAIYGNGSSLLATSLPTGFNLIEVRVEGSDLSYWVDGAEVATTATGGALNFENISFGRGWNNSYGADIDLRAACLVEGILSADDRQKLEGWMMQQVGDQASLPVSHTYRNTVFSDPASYSPIAEWDYYFDASDATKAGWSTVLGGDGATTMFVSAPHLAGTSFGSEPALKANTTTYHGDNPPEGYFLNSTDGTIELTTNQGELELKMSMASETTDDGLTPGTGDFLRAFILNFNGNANDDLVKGSGANYPTAKIENVSGMRVKIGDNFNSLSNGSGTDDDESPFYFSPGPTNGDLIFFAYMRDVSAQNYFWWYGIVEAGSTRADLDRLDAISENSVYLKTSTGVRNDNQSIKTLKVNEGTGVGQILFKKDPIDFATADALVGDHFELLVSLL